MIGIKTFYQTGALPHKLRKEIYMSEYTNCSRCDCRISDEDTRWAFEEPYCDECFGIQFSYCDRCDAVIHAADGNYIQDTCCCDDCYDKANGEDDAPDNPVILPMDREEIVRLCRDWLYGKKKKRDFIKINPPDLELEKIREKVGRVSRPVYVYGLLDRTQYDFCITPDLREAVNEFLILNGIYWKYFEIEGTGRIGLCKRLRYDEFNTVIKLLKYLCKTRKKVLA